MVLKNCGHKKILNGNVLMNTEELLKKIQNGEPITCEDLGIHPNLAKCHTTIECGFRTFYTDGVNCYNIYGNLASYKDRKLYDLS